MVEHEAESAVTAPLGRSEGVVQVCFVAFQDDVALELRDVSAQGRRPAGVNGNSGRIEGKKAEIAAAESLAHDLFGPARVGGAEYHRDVVERGLVHREPRTRSSNLRSDVQAPPE